jgi:hypothetical protein
MLVLSWVLVPCGFIVSLPETENIQIIFQDLPLSLKGTVILLGLVHRL